MSIWHRITVDKKHSKLFGVCAGIANAFGYSRMGVRVTTVIGLLFAPIITLTIYATAAVLLPTRQQVTA
ncbi:PspC domain-containing protein [Psychrobium sp. MM17-31]|jgi:phage shock protein PspC (stress-responsive transcriptional regulator)|uniref:PspC domain-containing protein n=1 Tax=Psychrobium sp. MM17-31 TaxID=2917758 RepID=UPI001EF4F900|nr:PspC domain-containing protein [Psychrobium sp. MM17-31]MCG7530581.1 PspC domain-containing protein [Psychrobium sp. MM17-31]